MTRALIIDDNANNLDVLAEMLALEGVEAVTLQNPTRLPAMLAKDADFDLVFLDLEMPGAHGYTVLDSLQTYLNLQDAPVVAYTVHVSEINEAKKHGFHSFLGKPLNADLFPEQLSRILTGEPVWETP